MRGTIPKYRMSRLAPGLCLKKARWRGGLSERGMAQLYQSSKFQRENFSRLLVHRGILPPQTLLERPANILTSVAHLIIFKQAKMMMMLLLWAGVENWLAAQQTRNIAELLEQQERHRFEIIALQRSNQEDIDRREKAIDGAFEVLERQIGEISKKTEQLR